MIKLNVSPYCQNCPSFEVEVEAYSFDGFERFETRFSITCKHADKCNNLIKYLKKELANNGK